MYLGEGSCEPGSTERQLLFKQYSQLSSIEMVWVLKTTLFWLERSGGSGSILEIFSSLINVETVFLSLPGLSICDSCLFESDQIHLQVQVQGKKS